jgi:aspartate dehydrogenase
VIMRVVLIGYGTIGRQIVEAKTDGRLEPEIAGVLVKPGATAAARESLDPSIAVITSAEEAIRLAPDLVVECAGQGAIEQYGDALLSAGLDLMIIATGALAEPTIRDRLDKAAEAGDSRMHLPAGATAAIDGLGALKVGGLEWVTYTSTKPPRAWKGTPADGPFDLDAMTEPTEIYSGPADQAARLYPKNANLAATVALAGIGFAKTEVKLVADPGAVINVGRIEAKGRFGHMTMEMRGQPMPDNPKTSAVTGLSLIRAINNFVRRLAI